MSKSHHAVDDAGVLLGEQIRPLKKGTYKACYIIDEETSL